MLHGLRQRLKVVAIAAAVAALLLPVQDVRAGLADEMDRMLDSMTNVTSPSAHMGQRRGYLGGGRFSKRVRPMTVPLFQVQAPKVEAGCSGLDIFGGGMSFISAKEFIQLLRNIGQMADGYAFKLALDAMCPSCMGALEDLRKEMAKLNDMTLNSCTAAEGLYQSLAMKPDNSNSALDKALSGSIRGVADKLGGVSDAVKGHFPFAFGINSEAEVTRNTSDAVLKEEGFIGNVVWEALTTQGAQSWWSFGDEELLEAFMSLTGTVVIVRNGDPSAGQTLDPVQLEPLITVEDLLYGTKDGNSLRVYDCPSSPAGDVDGDNISDCLAPSIVSLNNFKGMVDRVREILLGNGSRLGLVTKFSRNVGRFERYESAFLDAIPAPVAAMIRNSALVGEDMATLIAGQAAEPIALMLVDFLVNDMVRAVELSLLRSDMQLSDAMAAKIKEVRQQLREQTAHLQSRSDNLLGVVKTYRDLMEMTPAQAVSVLKRIER